MPKGPGLVAYLRTWAILGSSTVVCVHTVMDVEQFDHKLVPPFLQRRLTRGAGSHTLWCSKREVPTGVNLNPYAGGRIIYPLALR